MLKLNQKGFAHIFLLLILGLGIIAGVYLVQHPQIFKPKAYNAQVDPRLYKERVDNLRVKFKVSEDTPDDSVQNRVKNDLLTSDIRVEGDIANGDATVSVEGDCLDNEQTNYALSEFGAFPPLCLTDEQKQKAIKIVQSGVESAADFVLPYSQAKQALEFGSDIASMRDLLRQSGIAERNQLSAVSGPASSFDGYAITLIRIHELEEDVKNHPDGSGDLTEGQEVARREYVASLRKLWEEQHNMLLGLATTAAAITIDKPLRLIGDVAKPITGPLVAKFNETVTPTKNAVFDFMRGSWEKLKGRESYIAIPKNLSSLVEKRVRLTAHSLEQAFPDLKAEIFSTEGSSGIIYNDRENPNILYKVFSVGDDNKIAYIEDLISNTRYAEEEAKKLTLLSEEGIAPRLVEYVPPALTDEQNALLKNPAFGSFKYKINSLPNVPLSVSNRITDAPIIVMAKAQIDPVGFVKLAQDPERKEAEIKKIISILEKYDLIPLDTEPVVDTSGHILFIDLGGITPRAAGYQDWSIEQWVRKLIK